jgi:hypothetical protein
MIAIHTTSKLYDSRSKFPHSLEIFIGDESYTIVSSLRNNQIVLSLRWKNGVCMDRANRRELNLAI